MPLTLVHHRFTVDEYEEMVTYGILTENDRVELIRGEILTKMTIGDPHAGCVNRLNRLLTRRVGDDALLSIQNPIRLADSEPEPDVMVLRPRADFYGAGKPVPADAFLIIEVSDSSLDFDRDVKGPLYAEAGIAEYWIVNLSEECVEVHRGPQPNGLYADVQVLRRGQQVQAIQLPACTVTVDEIL